MPEVVISDTSCIIILEKIGALHLLHKLYLKLFVTPEVAHEFGKELPPWIEIKKVANPNYLLLLESQMDLGEASSIALALESDKVVLLLLDDLKARKVAKRLGLHFTGTLGVIHKAKHEGYIENVKPFLLSLKETNFRIADKVLNELLRLNGE